MGKLLKNSYVKNSANKGSMQKLPQTEIILEKYKTDILTRYQYKPKKVSKDPEEFGFKSALSSFEQKKQKPIVLPKIDNKIEEIKKV